MDKRFLIMKTGSTIPGLLATGVDFEDWFAAGLGLPRPALLVCAVHQGQTLPDLSAVAAIIVTGSPAYVTDAAPWNEIAADYLRQAHAEQVPILGVCYGHQLLAWAFGGSVYFHPGGREIGSASLTLTGAGRADELLGILPGRFTAQLSHQQSVERLPEQAVLLAAGEFEPCQAFRLGQCSWGVQFHPEFSGAVVSAYIREREQAIRAEGLDPDQLLAQVKASTEAELLLARFVEIASG